MSCSVTERVTSRAGASPSSANPKCRGSSLATLTTSPNNRGEGAQATGPRPPQNGPHSSPVQEVPRDYSFRSKPCCTLLWCCCCKCPCSNIGNKGNEENGGAAKNSTSELYSEGITQPSLDEIRSWGKSFDKLMKSPGGRKVFQNFLKGEYSEENILFWLACEDLRKQTSKDVIEEKARLIYEDFISILSPREVSLDSRVREIVNRNMVEPTSNTFDEAQLQIYLLMNRDSYPRFVNSQMYKSLAQIDKIEKEKQTTSSASSVTSTDFNSGTAIGQTAPQTTSSTAGASSTATTPLLTKSDVQKEQVLPKSADTTTGTSPSKNQQQDVK